MLTWLVIFLFVIGTAAYFRTAQVVWNAALGGALLIFSFTDYASLSNLAILWALFFAVVVPLEYAACSSEIYIRAFAWFYA